MTDVGWSIARCRDIPWGQKELLVLYHERWEIEIVIDEIKTHLRVQQEVLRSHTPEGGAPRALRAVRGALRHPRLDASLGPAIRVGP